MARWEAGLIVTIGVGLGLAIAAAALLPLSHALTGNLLPYVPLGQLAAIIGVSALLASWPSPCPRAACCARGRCRRSGSGSRAEAARKRHPGTPPAMSPNPIDQPSALRHVNHTTNGGGECTLRIEPGIWRHEQVVGAPSTASWRSGDGSASCSWRSCRQRRDGEDTGKRPERGGRVGRASAGDPQTRSRSTSTEEILMRNARAAATAPAFRADRRRRAAPAGRGSPYEGFESPYAPGNQARVSADGHSALLRFQLDGKESEAEERVEPRHRGHRRGAGGPAGFAIDQFGEASASKQNSEVISEDFQRALLTSLPITLLILLVTFGALVAASIPSYSRSRRCSGRSGSSR